MRYLRVKNWEEFQHYKDRAPPWIKLHRTLLDDFEFSELPDDSKGHLMLLWLLAGQLGGRIPANAKYLQSKIGAVKAPNLKLLVDKGFLVVEQDASDALSASTTQSVGKHYARDMSDRAGARSPLLSSPLVVPHATAGDHARDLETPTDAHRTLATSLGVDCDLEWAQFEDRIRMKGKPWFSDKAAAFRTWLRQERKYADRDGRAVDSSNPKERMQRKLQSMP